MFSVGCWMLDVAVLLSCASAPAATRYVWQNSPNPGPPFTNWTTAAHVIQDAVDAAQTGDTVLVASGVYATGGRAVYGTMTNRAAIDRAITVESLLGPEVTIIQGYQVPGTTNGNGAIRCVYLTNGASLSGFTLTNGATRAVYDYPTNSQSRGGGVMCESSSALVSNCVISGNSAYDGGGAYRGLLNNCTLTGNSANTSGGASGGTLNHCTLSGNVAYYSGGGVGYGILDNCMLTSNSARYYGGGAYYSTLNNCTLTGNSASSGGGAYESTSINCTLSGNSASVRGGGAHGGTLSNCTATDNAAASYGGGAYGSTLNNCIVYFNTAATNGANWHEAYSVNYCCTTPPPTNGVGNITNAPLFVDYAGGNLRLQSDSPCINAGFNAYVPGLTDLDGFPRIVSGAVDIGAYEFQGAGSVISYAWLQQFGLPTDGLADFTDPDRDGHTTWQEWRCLTDPTNALSALRLLSASPAGTNVTVSWQSVAGVNYFLERSTNLRASPPFTLLAPNLPGQPGTTSYTDTNAAPLPPLFYRVGVAP
jgi:hypothetical protein